MKYEFSYNVEEDCYVCKCDTEIGSMRGYGATKQQAKKDLKKNIAETLP